MYHFVLEFYGILLSLTVLVSTLIPCTFFCFPFAIFPHSSPCLWKRTDIFDYNAPFPQRHCGAMVAEQKWPRLHRRALTNTKITGHCAGTNFYTHVAFQLLHSLVNPIHKLWRPPRPVFSLLQGSFSLIPMNALHPRSPSIFKVQNKVANIIQKGPRLIVDVLAFGLLLK
jgi:hypothetical protein